MHRLCWSQEQTVKADSCFSLFPCLVMEELHNTVHADQLCVIPCVICVFFLIDQYRECLSIIKFFFCGCIRIILSPPRPSVFPLYVGLWIRRHYVRFSDSFSIKRCLCDTVMDSCHGAALWSKYGSIIWNSEYTLFWYCLSIQRPLGFIFKSGLQRAPARRVWPASYKVQYQTPEN